MTLKIYVKINKKYKLKSHYFWAIGTTLSSNISLRFRCNVLEKVLQNELKNITLAGKLTLFDNKIETKRAQYNLDRETANISVFSSGMST